ncbi:MAG: hypothetical protein ABI551_13775 [Polyangiaceae bacterium]
MMCAAFTAAGCSLFVDLGGLTNDGGDAGPSDASPDGPTSATDGDGASVDDAGPLLQADGGPYLATPIIDVGAVPAETGNAQRSSS